MHFSCLCFLHLLLFTSLVLGAPDQEEEEEKEKICLENNLSPIDEDPDPEYDDHTVMAEFLERLEIYTGLNNTEIFSVSLKNCGGQQCVVNPNGDAIWDARMDLYLSNLMDETYQKTTLDGCLCYSDSITDYRNCMTVVREKMFRELDTFLVERFKTIVESDCSAVAVNCVAN